MVKYAPRKVYIRESGGYLCEVRPSAEEAAENFIASKTACHPAGYWVRDGNPLTHFLQEDNRIPTKRWAAMPAKNCTVCGVEYVPGSGASRYCPACAKKIRREKSNESKRRSREQKRIACMNCPQKMTD